MTRCMTIAVLFFRCHVTISVWSQRLLLQVRWGTIDVRHQKGGVRTKAGAAGDSVALRYDITQIYYCSELWGHFEISFLSKEKHPTSALLIL